MTLNRFLKYINILIGILVLVALGTGYWVFYRPLPETSGSIVAPVESPGIIVRDELGVPHITADLQEDALFLQGFATAQDRMFQMDLVRRRANGELAEILGPAVLSIDRRSRELRLAEMAEQHSAVLRPQDRAALSAYARGVNHYLEKRRGRLPVEFRLAGYEPRPWRVADSVAIGLQMSATLSETWPREILKGDHRQRGDAEKVSYLYPLRSGLESVPGSNAWVLSGEHTASGKPVLANDPHLEFSVPSIWHQVRIQSPELSVAGAVMVGLPGVMIGHNDRIAWGATNLLFDVQDLYAERLDTRTGRYVFQGRMLQAARRQEVIRVKGQNNVTLNLFSTVHGPVVVSQGPLQLALRWTVLERNAFAYPFIEMGRASNWKEFRAALSEFVGPPQNFVYADVDGNIGYQAAGRLPLRSYDGSVPLDGVSGKFEWDGFIPFEELPTVFNPAAGAIVTANQNPFPEEYPHPVGGEFAPGYRERRIRELLAARTGWKPEDLLGVQTDILDPMLQAVGAVAAAAFRSRGIASGELTVATRLLEEWDGMMRADEAAPLVASLLYGHLRRAMAEKSAAGAGQSYSHQMSPALVERLLKERPPEWFANYDQLLLRSLVDAVEEGKRMQGPDIADWQWGRRNQLRLSAGVVERLPLIGSRFGFDPRPMSGSSNTVKQTTTKLGPSLRVVMDLGDWERSLVVLPPGESGHVVSGHFRDQAETYWGGAANVFSYQQVSGEDRLEIVPER